MRRPGVFILIVSLIIGGIYIKFHKTPEIDSKRHTVSMMITNVSEKEYCTVYTSEHLQMVYNGRKRPCISTGDVISAQCIQKDMDAMAFDKFDYGRYLKSCGIREVYEMKSWRKTGESRFYKIIGNVREEIIRTNIQLYKDKAGILNAMTVGDRSLVDKKDRDVFMDSGTSHVMAISGLHVSIICAIIVLFYGKMRNLRTFFCISIFLLMYGKLVGGGASVTRAVSLIILVFISFLIEERADVINLISIIAGVMILENPYIVYNISFQLSFLCIGAISVLNKYLKKLFYGNTIPSTVSATLATAPVVLYSFKEMSTVGILGNIAAIPVAGIVILMDIADVILYRMGFYAAFLLAEFNSFIIGALMYVLKKIGNYGTSNIVIRDMKLKTLVIYYIFLLAVLGFLYVFSIVSRRYDGEENISN